MPRYQLTAHFNEDELRKIDDLCIEKGWIKKGKPNHYVFLRTASLSLCEACEKEKKQDEQGRNPSRESPQVTGKTDTSDRNAEQQARPSDLTLPEAANHIEPLDIGL
jgi:ribosome-binding protein aMBF1 (putative translation factor)